MASPFQAHADTEAAAQRFATTCAGCHAGGGNIVKRDATLALDDLRKYGLDSPDALYQLIYSGKGSMPGYGAGCAPKGACTFGPRLADGDVTELAEYVLAQADKGWPS
jgi:cytochrome c6